MGHPFGFTADANTLLPLADFIGNRIFKKSGEKFVPLFCGGDLKRMMSQSNPSIYYWQMALFRELYAVSVAITKQKNNLVEEACA